jgi:hypothetical protein
MSTVRAVSVRYLAIYGVGIRGGSAISIPASDWIGEEEEESG